MVGIGYVRRVGGRPDSDRRVGEEKGSTTVPALQEAVEELAIVAIGAPPVPHSPPIRPGQYGLADGITAFRCGVAVDGQITELFSSVPLAPQHFCRLKIPNRWTMPKYREPVQARGRPWAVRATRRGTNLEIVTY